MKLHGTMGIKDNTLYIGGVSTKELAKKYNTPLYVFDEELIRGNCREYKEFFKVKENKNKIAYAGKAFLTKYMCKLVCEEGLCLDVVSGDLRRCRRLYYAVQERALRPGPDGGLPLRHASHRA